MLAAVMPSVVLVEVEPDADDSLAIIPALKKENSSLPIVAFSNQDEASLVVKTIKLGASNMLNSYYITSFGSAYIGGLYYITITYDDLMGYLKRKNSK